MNPQFEDEKPVNPFDLWEGASFRLKIRQFEGYANYDKSEFDGPGPLFEDDEKLERVWKDEHSLQEIIHEKHFKPYAELKAKLHRVLNLTGDSVDASRSASDDVDEDLDMSRFSKSAPAPDMKQTSSDMDTIDDDDEDLARFRDLIK